MGLQSPLTHHAENHQTAQKEACINLRRGVPMKVDAARAYNPGYNQRPYKRSPHVTGIFCPQYQQETAQCPQCHGVHANFPTQGDNGENGKQKHQDQKQLLHHLRIRHQTQEPESRRNEEKERIYELKKQKRKAKHRGYAK